MRVLFFGNNWVGHQVIKWLRSKGEDIVGAVVHPPERSKFRDEIIDDSGLELSSIFDGSKLRDEATRRSIFDLGADIGVSAYFGYMIDEEMFQSLPRGCLNLHPSFLPYNRGAYPNVWALVDGTPAGVSLHYIDEGVDTGDIVAQKEVEIEPIDTGSTLYRRLEEEAMELFKATWPLVKSDKHTRAPQSREEGTLHAVKDVEKIDAIDLDAQYKARDLIDLIRARTYPPYKGAYFEISGRRVYVRLELEYGD